MARRVLLLFVCVLIHGVTSLEVSSFWSTVNAGASAVVGRKSWLGRAPVVSAPVFSPEDAADAGAALSRDLDLGSTPRLELARTDSPFTSPSSPRLSCAKAQAASEGRQCPHFHACSVSPPAHTGILRTAADTGPEVAVSACWAGDVGAEPAVAFSKPPLNCDAWYSMTDAGLAQLLEPFRRQVGAGQPGLGAAHEAMFRLLAQQPALGCAHPEDFFPQRPKGSMVFQLRHAYVSSDAAVFSDSAVFQRPGCRSGAKCSPVTKFGAGATRVLSVNTAVNLAHTEGHTWEHSLLSALPAFLALGPILAKAKDTPVLGLRGQFDIYQHTLAPLLGVPLEGLNSRVVEEGQLLQVDSLFQPSFQTCGQYSKTVWTEMRRAHLLHPEGVPMFNPDWSLRATTPLSDEEMAKVADDWVVVIARRPGRKAAPSLDKIPGAVTEQLSPNRVVVYNGNLPVSETRALFRRARLFISESDEALSNMIFMPKEASVLEVRPDSVRSACYHMLADACSLNYRLVVLKRPEQDSNVVTEVARLARKITHS